MSSKMQGYYSIIQYCPDPSRLETVNLGVALFCPEVRFLKARLGRRKTRVRQLFGKQDWEFVDVQRAAIEARLEHEKEEFRTLDDFGAFVGKRASAFRMTTPRPVKVENPEQELGDLLARLVGPQEESRTTTGRVVSKELRERFRIAGVEEKLEPNPVVVRAPSLPKPFRAPFAFRNGRLNLIAPMAFEGMSGSEVFNRTSIHAVEGQLLAEYKESPYGDLGLIVVGKFGADQEEDRRRATEVFEKHGVVMHTFAVLDGLIEQIRRPAHRV
jgi:hypothetical protein